MSGDTVGVTAEPESGRARPLSGGLWTLFSWLRREDSSSSTDSLSSAGSDRTAVSFAFLAPPPPRARITELPPFDPPTDSYRKRVRDRNLQRRQDRDLTLHRKYGLYYGYDAFSLPPARKNLIEVNNVQDRERRATSESLPRRIAHVPGKRRAPLPPPVRPHSIASTASLSRRYNRKRPAPQPPIKFPDKVEENIQKSGLEKLEIIIQMNSKSEKERQPLSSSEKSSTGSKQEKQNKLEDNPKNTKTRTEKSFLKQIFENKKRNSTIESAPERILPSISELDKQAAEIINSCKLKPLDRQDKSNMLQAETWFCTRCLRKYDSTVVTCEVCLPEQKRLSNGLVNNFKNTISTASSTHTQTEKHFNDYGASSSRNSPLGRDEKQKLKEMLKEIKDSLPKRPKHENNDKILKNNTFAFNSVGKNESLETPTLRIGANAIQDAVPSTSKEIMKTGEKISNVPERELPEIKTESMAQNVVITQRVVLVAPQSKDSSNINLPKSKDIIRPASSERCSTVITVNKGENEVIGQNILGSNDKNNLYTPLKLSSLLNPVYIPKNITKTEIQKSSFLSQNPSEKATSSSSIFLTSASPSKQISPNVSKLEVGIVENTGQSEIAKENLSKNVDLQRKLDVHKNLPKIDQSPATCRLNIQSLNAACPSTSSNKSKLMQSNLVKFTVDQHSRRRELINQLEQSIAKGDERAAAEAASKLAQLRLSCSVLSFSSQIIAENTQQEAETSQSNVHKRTETTTAQTSGKIDAAVQSITFSSPKNSQCKSTNENTEQDDKPSKSSASTAANLPNKPLRDNIQEQVSVQPSTSKQNSKETSDNLITIQVWVEDREATRGPVRLQVPRQALLGELRRQAETTLGLAGALQRWIVGRTLCNDDRTPLVSLAGHNLAAPFYLCVVQSETNEPASKKCEGGTQTNNVSEVYSELVQLEQRALVTNAEEFECGVCMETCAVGGGAVLRECVHTFCRECLVAVVRHCEEPVVTCPAMGCPGILQEREIRSLTTPEEYERWLARGLAAAEKGTRNAFHCRTRDCTGWALCDPGVRRFPCPVCEHTNCITCQAIHEGETCEQYQAKLQEAQSSLASGKTDEGTEALLETLITKGEALKCPECSAIITKKWGCDWVKCSACKTEICWVTKGRRWGPNGKGDTSGGCRCGVDGKRCHPSCGYCH